MSEPLDILYCRDFFILFSELSASVSVKSCKGELAECGIKLDEQNKQITVTITNSSITVEIFYNGTELKSFLDEHQPPPGEKYVDILAPYNNRWKKILSKALKDYNEDTAREIASFAVDTARDIISKYIAFLPNITLTVFFDEIEQIVIENKIIIYDMQWR